MRSIKRIPTFFHEFKGKAITVVDPTSYRLTVEGAVNNCLELSLGELEHRMPVIETRRRFYCVNGWSFEAIWRGFELVSLLELCGPLCDAPFLRAISIAGYEDTSGINSLIKGGAMLVTHMDGEPLSPERGFPMRLMTFDRYQFRGVKALARIEIVRKYAPGAWVRYGYTDSTIQPFPHLALDTGEELMPDPDVLRATPDEL